MDSTVPSGSLAPSKDDRTQPAGRATVAYRRRRTQRVVSGAIAVALVIVGLVAAMLWHQHEQQRTHGLADLKALDLLVAAQTERTFETASVVLDGIAEDFQAAGIASPATLRQAAGDETSYRLLRAKMAGVPQLDSLTVLDAEGNVVNHSRSFPPVAAPNYASSDTFLRLRDHPELGHYISPPLQDAGGAWTIYIGKRLSAPNGAFVGILLGAIPLRYFEGVYNDYLKAIAGDGRAIALWRNDGILLARVPQVPADTATTFRQANRAIPADGLDAFWDDEAKGSFAVIRRQLEDFPLMVELRQPASAIVEQWNGQTEATLAGTISLLAMVGFAVWLLLRQLHAADLVADERARADREAQARADIQAAMTKAETAMRDAQHSEARFRDIVEVGSDWIWETDAQHRFTMVTGARRPKVDLIGMTRWEQAGVDPEADELWRAHKAQLDAHQPFRQFRFSITLPTGRFDVCVNGKPIFDDDGSFIGYRGTVTDETELVAAREQAARADALLRNAIDSIAEGFVIYDAEDRFVLCNEAYRKMYGENAVGFVPGVTYEQIMRQALATGRHPDAAGHEEEWLAQRMRKHLEAIEPEESRLADGRWVMRSERRMADGGIAGLRIDITALKASQDALRQNETILSSAQRVGRMGSIFRDYAADVSHWSDEMFRLLGVTRESFAPSTGAFLAMVHPDDRDAVETSLKATPKRGERDTVLFRIIRPDGTLRWLHREAERLFDDAERPTGAIATFQDVTELHLAQEAVRENQFMLSRAQRIAGIGSVLRKLNGTVEWSDEMFNLFGVTRDTFDPGDTERFLNFIPPDDRARVRKAIEDNRRGIRVEPLQFRIIRPDGAMRWVYREVEVFHDRAGKPSEFLTTYKDITDHINSETRLRELEAMLRDAIESIQAGFVIYDADDRLVICNEAYRRLYPVIADLIVPGVHFGDILRAQFARGYWPEMKGREEEWIADWLRWRRTMTAPVEVQMQDGRWVLVSERPMSNGWLAGLRVDITELKNVQQSLRESQVMLNRAQRLSSTASAVRNLKTDAVEWSDEMYRMFGLERGAVTPGREQFRAYIHPEDRDRVPSARGIALDGRSVPPMQFRIVRPDGAVRWVYREVELIRDAADKVTSVLTTYKDITERRELEALLRDAIESIQAGFVIYDADDRLVMCNEAYRRLYPDIAHLEPGVHFADILRTQGHDEEWIANWLRQRRAMTAPVEMQTKDGRWVLVYERPMSNGGLAGLRIDITELKNIQQSLRESQQRLDRTQRIAHIGTIERNLRTNEVIWSDETYRIFGVDRETHAPEGDNLLALVHPDDREMMMTVLRRGSNEPPNSSTKFRAIRPNGEVRTILAQADVAKDEAGSPLYLSVAMMDITEKEAASNRQAELETQLRHSEKLTALGTLAGGIAHDLNNTLVPIQALSKLVMHDLAPDAAARTDLETIYQASLQARDLVRQILAFSRKQEIVRAPTDVGAKLRETLQMLRASVPSTIELVERIEPVPQIFTDAGQIQQILVNLVTNGAFAIGDKVGRITVSLDEIADAAAEDGRMIRLTVADTGCGMSADVIHRIFEPFFTTKSVGEGTGLGLSVVHGIVTSQGGSIDVASTPGKGSKFVILLPARAVPTEIAAVA